MSFVLSQSMSDSHEVGWGRSVFSLVNDRLSIELDYTPPPACLSQTEHDDIRSQIKEHVTSPPTFLEHLHSDPLQQQVSDSDQPISQAQETRTSPKSNPREESWSKSSNQKPLHGHNWYSSLPERRKPSEMYSQQRPSAHSLRMPDFFKRVFAPPNCLTPDISSPEKPTRKVENMPRRCHTNKILHQVVVGTLTEGQDNQEKRTNKPIGLLSRTTRAEHNAPLNNISTNVQTQGVLNTGTSLSSGSDISALSSFNADVSQSSIVTQTSLGADEMENDILEALPERPRNLTYSESIYSATNGAARLYTAPSTTEDADEESLSAQQATLGATQRVAQVERDIDSFLRYAVTPNSHGLPKTSERNGSTGHSETRTACSSMESVEIAQNSSTFDQASKKSRGLYGMNFFPRQTIGKLKRSGNRRTLSIDSC